MEHMRASRRTHARQVHVPPHPQPRGPHARSKAATTHADHLDCDRILQQDHVSKMHNPQMPLAIRFGRLVAHPRDIRSPDRQTCAQVAEPDDLLPNGGTAALR